MRDDLPYPNPMDGGVKFYLYTMLNAMNSAGPLVRIKSIDDSTEVLPSSGIVNLLAMFTDQVVSNRGVCFNQGGRYYALQAPCSGSVSSSITPGLGGSLPVNPTTVVF